jgi:AcrR family transcriptional regulator
MIAATKLSSPAGPAASDAMTKATRSKPTAAVPAGARRRRKRVAPGGDPVPRTQQERRQEAESRLLATAREIVSRKGWAGTTLADVGEAAGYSRGLAGHHFGSKTGLLRAITQQINNSLMDLIRAAPPARPGLQSILSFIGVYLGRTDPRWSNTRTLLILLIEALLDGSENADQMINFNASMFAYLEENVRVGIRNGEIDRSVSAGVAAEFIVGTLRGMMLQRLVRGGEIDTRPMRRQVLAMVTRALAAARG